MAEKSVLLRLGADATGLLTGLKQGQKGLSDFERGVDQVTGKLTDLAAGIGLGLGLATLAAQASALAESTVKLAAQTGMSTDEIQRLNFIAGQTGTTVDALVGAVNKMQRSLVEGSDGSGKAAEALKGMGIEVSDLLAMKPSEQLQAIADGLANIPDPATRTATAMDILGKSGAEAIPSLLEMADKSVDVAAGLERIGGPVSEQAIRTVESLGDEVNTTKTSLVNLATSILADAAPALTSFLQTAQEVFGGLRVLAGGGSNAIVNLDRQIDELQGRLDSFKANNPFPDAFGQKQISDMEKMLAQLKATEEEMLGLGAAGKQTNLVMQQATDIYLEMPVLAAEALGQINDLEAIRLAADEARMQARVQLEKDEWNLRADIVRAGHEKIEVESAVHQTKLEQFNALSWDAQVATVSGALVKMTEGIAQHSRGAFEINKIATMANVIVNTIQAVTKAWADYGWPYGAVIGAAIAAAGAAQLSAVRSTTFNGGGRGTAPSQATTPNTPTSGGGSGGAGSGGVLRVEGLSSDAVLSGASARTLAEKLLEFQKDGGQVVFAQ